MAHARRMLIAFALLAVCGHALAQAPAYPVRPVRLIVGFPPGGAADILGRITALKLGEAFGQQFVVDNRGGAGGLIATEIAARAAPDGYTLLLTSPPHAINAALYRKAAYDPIRDFTAVVHVVSTAMVLAAHPAVPFRNVSELVSQSKASPGKFSYGSGGSGASGHLAMELFKAAARVDIVHVPYKGTGPVLNDLIAGQIQLTVGSAAPTLPQVRAGKVRALAVTGKRRSLVAPDVPTIAESGYPDFEVTQWFGILAPAGTPASVVATINGTAQTVLRQADTRERFLAQSSETVGGPPAAMDAVVRAEVARWGKLVRDLKLNAD